MKSRVRSKNPPEIHDLKGRLTSQLAAKGVSNPEGMALSLLRKQGSIDANGNYTKHGKERMALGAAGRAIDRQARYTGRDKTDFSYNRDTNQALVKKGKRS